MPSACARAVLKETSNSDHDLSFSSGEGGLPHQARVFGSIYNYLYFSGTPELETKALETCLGMPLQRVAFQKSKIPFLQNLQGVRAAEGVTGEDTGKAQSPQPLLLKICVEFESL